MDLIMSTTQGHMACILNTIPNFYVLEGCVPDIMHIFLEGVCRLILKVLLIYIICTQRYISIEIVNSRLSALDFGHCGSTNIPTLLTRTHLQKGSFSQSGRFYLKFNYQLAVLNVVSVQGLPFIIGDKVLRSDLIFKLHTNGISALKSSIVDCLHLTLATVIQPILPHHSQEHICEKDPFHNQVGFIF